MSPRPVVVGVDGSDVSAAAARWAAAEAERRGTELIALYASGVGERSWLSSATSAAVEAESVAYGRRVLAATEATVAELLPHVPVRSVHSLAAPAEALLELSSEAALVVVGRRRRRTGTAGLSQQVAGYAHCPVVVVPHTALDGRRAVATVAVGVARSAGAMDALDSAFDHAQRVGGRVLAVRAWGELDWARSVSMYNPLTAERWRQASQHLLGDCVGEVAASYPGVPVERKLVRGGVMESLMAAAAGADLLLLGSRRRDAPGTCRLSWASTVLLANAPCPVGVIGRSNRPGATAAAEAGRSLFAMASSSPPVEFAGR